MTPIAANLQAVNARIAAACAAASRPPGTVTLLAVSKSWPEASILAAAAAGQGDFGESYLQEALPKLDALADAGLEWHFIGPLQSNKTRPVAEHFDWVHSVERLKIAERLSAQRPATRPPLNVCLQVNVSGEASKSGCAPAEIMPLAHAVATLPGLRLRGLMTIPEPTEDETLLRSRFALLRQLRDELNDSGLALDTLSMGMSDDLETAIAEGATIVRVGTAIFGIRNQESL
ncbi:YggS family pyridoxal phosphate-dependent enzyme [Denitratisoma oestradiolicum]|uniref:Pyridoxal phosphate homeostasis protein n=1 Tax=Denitratisoma oestradiolicum TaxID=311182 RepID=A0A6S6YI48_9PROT|nr:YggS family pyridoxal phosphate-dependent enzyme [Denitratisoma oestradiolicum]TWO81029.1 YggS family pyridoxal phosphate enzyme [Denitratisoma oestradiolicum]CAB1367424.1 putative enzyme [Denitratisoma oestradiolicum]